MTSKTTALRYIAQHRALLAAAVERGDESMAAIHRNAIARGEQILADSAAGRPSVYTF